MTAYDKLRNVEISFLLTYYAYTKTWRWVNERILSIVLSRCAPYSILSRSDFSRSNGFVIWSLAPAGHCARVRTMMLFTSRSIRRTDVRTVMVASRLTVYACGPGLRSIYLLVHHARARRLIAVRKNLTDLSVVRSPLKSIWLWSKSKRHGRVWFYTMLAVWNL